MKEPLVSLFLELANPDEKGESQKIYKTQFINEYSKLDFNNGCPWMRSLKGLYTYETFGRGYYWYIKLTGKDRGYINRSVRGDIVREITSRVCAHTGFSSTTQNGMECDHKNGRYNDLDALDTYSQTMYDFQPLCRQANLQKRSDCKSCKISGIRFDATQLGYKTSYIEGGFEYEGSCKGCYWEDCLKFKETV